MNSASWYEPFQKLYHKALSRYEAGPRPASELFKPEDVKFLATIGCTAQELFDFIEDYVKHGEPSYEACLLITAVRRDYFLVVQKGVHSTKVASMESLPPKTDEVEGIVWLPRLIEKARLKLRGEMNPDLMYGCGGDRPFASRMNIDLADFLRVVWAKGEYNKAIVDFVKRSADKGSEAGFKTL